MKRAFYEPGPGGAVRAAGPFATGACGAGGLGFAIHPAKALAEGCVAWNG